MQVNAEEVSVLEAEQPNTRKLAFGCELNNPLLVIIM